jgi:DNA-binding transcriptional regulator YdaS (Cro superfamily)
MKLKDWLAKTGTQYAVFAPRIGVANASVVSRYVNGRVPRSKEVRAAIVRETNGEVTLPDLYAAAAE